MRILLVEDNPDHRELMSLALTRHDPTWQVEGVVSGEEALRRLAEGEAPDVVFLDYNLPGQGGLEVLGDIQRGGASFPVVMVTGHGNEQVAVEAMKGGAYDYVAKGKGYLQRLPVLARRAVEAHQLEEELNLAQAQLIQASKMTALGEMISGVAHEINNPLTTIAGYAQLLQDEAADDQVKEDLQRIRSAAMRARKIVQNLLAFARQRKPVKEPIDINQVIAQVLAIRAHSLELDKIEVVRELGEGLPYIEADPNQMQQVFLNLINNAQYFMAQAHGGGTLTIRSQSGDDKIRAEVEDTGPGIPEENLDKIFDPFFTTKKLGEGTGLGLSVSYSIVRDHGGRIWAESEGEGATFIVELPVETACEGG